MIRILLPFALILPSIGSCYDNEDDLLSGYTDRFSTVTRGDSHPQLSTSSSVYALDAAAHGVDRLSPFSDFVSQGGSSPEADDYEEQMMATMNEIQRKKEESRQFDKDGLANFIIREMRINPSDLDRSAGTILDRLNVVEGMINIHLKTLKEDIVHVFVEKSEMSKGNLITPDLIKRRYENAIGSIREVMSLSGASSDEMMNLAFRYFVMNVSGILTQNCEITPSDTHEIWQLKSDMLQRNIKTLQGLFSALSIEEKKNTLLSCEIEKLVQKGLVSFYDNTCSFFAQWYKNKRSTWSQGLQLIGARNSNTKLLFDNFDSAYRTLFPFLFNTALTKQHLDGKRAALFEVFNATEKGFAEAIPSVSSLFSWAATPSPAQPESSAAILAPQPTKASASSGWGTWWG